SEYWANRSAVLSCRTLLFLAPALQSSRGGFCDSRVPTAHALRFVNGPVPAPPPSPKVCSLWSSPAPVLSVVSGHPCTVSAVSGHLLYCVRSLWSSPVLCPQSLVISCTVSAVSGHLLYCVRSLWSSPVLCPQSLVISCTVSAVSGHLLYCVRSLWSSPVLCPQSLVISCTVSAVSGHLLYCVRSLWSSPVLCLQSLVIS
ncbi:unnamed protein product, partial [Staurois parvus]